MINQTQPQSEQTVENNFNAGQAHVLVSQNLNSLQSHNQQACQSGQVNNHDCHKNTRLAKRLLTLPGTPIQNSNDNANYDLICRANQKIKNQKRKIQYQILQLLGKGTFGQVFLCQNQKKVKMAIKIIKSRPAYINQGLLEAKVWKQWGQLQKFIGIQTVQNPCLKIYDAFMQQNHLFLVQELMQNSFLDILKQNQFQGIGIRWIQKWTKSLLFSLFQVHEMGIIHCDVKPENVMFRKDKPQMPVLMDFSCCCFQKKQVYTYIQSRFYRAPEVIMGCKPYTDKIDIWSLGCMLVQLYIGLPLFPGSSSFDQIIKITQVCGLPSNQMIQKSQFGSKYFAKQQQPRLLDPQQYAKSNIQQKQISQSKSYFKLSCLDDLIINRDMKDIQIHQLFINLIKKMLVVDPLSRISAKQAYLHPFCGGSIQQLQQIQDSLSKMKNSSTKKQNNN